MVLLIIIPFWKMAISLGIYPTFSDKAMCSFQSISKKKGPKEWESGDWSAGYSSSGAFWNTDGTWIHMGFAFISWCFNIAKLYKWMIHLVKPILIMFHHCFNIVFFFRFLYPWLCLDLSGYSILVAVLIYPPVSSNVANREGYFIFLV